MKMPSDPSTEWDALRAKIIGLGERSIRKSYYPELEQRLGELERFRALLDQSNDLIFLVQVPSGRFTDVNETAYRQLGYSREALLAMSVGDLVPRPIWEKLVALFADKGQIDQDGVTIATTFECISGAMPVEMSVRLVAFSDAVYAVIVARDITARKQLEAENEQLAAQFHQAQKMESIGQLAGGIAHDFNNLLVPILGYAELGMLDLAPDSRLYAYLKRIKDASERAASLTRQILAFSRQQVLEMKALDLNRVVREFEPMLRRLIGEDIDLQLHLADTLPLLKADQGQLEQVLLNLVINARDAMPDGGTLIIETGQVILDETYTTKHSGSQPGPHLLLTVNDTGRGMDATTRRRIFEPFFTTKAQGQGTGLGLATVFGIVKQHGGNIWVYSEPSWGTTFKIYLPAVEASVSVAELEYPQASSLGGCETVLLVEDEASVRQLVGDTLRDYGYQVLEAEEPKKGLTLAAAHKSPIHLLLTDVIMPQMSGRKLYQRLASERPGLKVLYMSGYTDNVILHHGVLGGGTAFLQKPFTIHSLLQKVRTILDG